MARTALFEWEGREYDHNPKSADWYWALGIVATAGTIASILFGDYLLAAVVAVAATAIALHAAKQPPVHRFRVMEDGLMIGEEFHPFARMESFSVLEDVNGAEPPWLSIKTEHWLYPHLVIPLERVDADALYAHFLRHVDESAHEPHFTDLVANLLGF
ncbi:MAG TPA: hypothetical protein VMT80_01795 [Candidatus Paceibacterota bacterium]|nr:hypothetical protein [Candidatus Paceibacterota bacterium]